MIFAMINGVIISKKKLNSNISKSYIGYMSASRNLLNKQVKLQFKQIKSNKLPEGEKESRPIEKTKKREINIQRGKLNLYELLEDQNSDLLNVYSSFFKVLYSHLPFYENDLEYKILKLLQDEYDRQEDKTFFCLEKIKIEDPKLALIYYKILKGTKFYDFFNKEGNPSFLDYFRVDNTHFKVPIKDASFELLFAIFNDEAFQIRILQEEKKLENLTHENIEKIVKNKTPMLEFFTFSDIRFKNENIVAIDKKTDIKIKKRI